MPGLDIMSKIDLLRYLFSGCFWIQMCHVSNVFGRFPRVGSIVVGAEKYLNH